MDPAAPGTGLREWFETMGDGHGAAAVAFDTRIDLSPVFTGRACRGIAKRLRRHGYRLAARPESFLVDTKNHLVDGETERATAWASALAAELDASSRSTAN